MKVRTVAPTKGDPYFTTKAKGGYSSCIEGNDAVIKRPWSGCTLPNCVGAALGIFNELGQYKSFKYAICGNAEDLYANASSVGLKTGDTPKVGAMICWRKGKVRNGSDGCGHVAIVQQIIDKNTIVISQSGWSSNRVLWTAIHKRGNGQWTDGEDSSWMKGYVFQGFIYNPATEGDIGPCPYSVPAKAVKKGSKGNNVKWLQWYLCFKYGYDIEIDGSFGPTTERLLKDFQKKRGLTADGSCGPATRAAILK